MNISNQIKKMIESNSYENLADLVEKIEELEQYKNETFYRLTTGDMELVVKKNLLKKKIACSPEERDEIIDACFSYAYRKFFVDDWEYILELVIEDTFEEELDTITTWPLLTLSEIVSNEEILENTLSIACFVSGSEDGIVMDTELKNFLNHNMIEIEKEIIPDEIVRSGEKNEVTNFSLGDKVGKVILTQGNSYFEVDLVYLSTDRRDVHIDFRTMKKIL